MAAPFAKAPGVGSIFNEQVLEAMRESDSPKPAIFVMSNPTMNAECTAVDAFNHARENIVFASENPFKNVEFDEEIHSGILYPPMRSIGDITAEVGVAVVRAAVAEELAEGRCDVEPRELRQMSKDETVEYVKPNMWDFSEQWQSDNYKVMKNKELMNEADTTSGSFTKFEDKNALKNECKVREKEEKKIGNISQGKGGKACSQIGNGGRGGSMLAEKMRELEMMDMNDVDHVLDMEEVLHNYSRLTCPVYLDIVDNFFVDMYSEFLIPKPSVTITNSSWRLGPLKF
ncbi:hypothetical protein LOK49_LG02G00967 [Camellia lanceoleosa]|uniref:Uncharacterized protein n=1 Tax=Camellia lanceoleosa TaxID=1840588 RepID=A0ACC0IMB1_9ERIC|nr:hypothetical protein LOK49_LG02G00967 [Camellia lanceoleosa]